MKIIWLIALVAAVIVALIHPGLGVLVPLIIAAAITAAIWLWGTATVLRAVRRIARNRHLDFADAVHALRTETENLPHGEYLERLYTIR